MIASATPRPERYVLSPVSPHAKVEMSKNEPSSYYKSEVRLPPMRVLEGPPSHSPTVQQPVNIPPLNYTHSPYGSGVSTPNEPAAAAAAAPVAASAPIHTPVPVAPIHTPHAATPHAAAPTQPLQLPQPQAPQPPQHLQPLHHQPPHQQHQQPHQQQQPPLLQPTPLPAPPQALHHPQSTTPQPGPSPQHAQMYGHIPPPMPMTHPMMPPYYTPFSGQDFKRKTFESKDTASHMYQMISQLETFVQHHGGDMRTMAHASSSPHTPLPSIDALNAMILRLRSCSAIFDEWRDNVVAIHQAAASTSSNSQYPPKTTPPASPLFINTNTKRKRKRSRSDASTTVCRGCGTTETPEWRKGPEGARTLCNACGLYHAKLAKRKGINVAGEAIRQKRMRTNLSE